MKDEALVIVFEAVTVSAIACQYTIQYPSIFSYISLAPQDLIGIRVPSPVAGTTPPRHRWGQVFKHHLPRAQDLPAASLGSGCLPVTTDRVKLCARTQAIAIDAGCTQVEAALKSVLPSDQKPIDPGIVMISIGCYMILSRF